MRYAKKSLGQNFLKDNNIIKKILSLAEIKNRNIIEIGPGTGALTYEILLRKPKSLTVIEKDNILAAGLRKKFSKNKNIKIINSDVLKLNFNTINIENYNIFGNLPYNISSQILIKILKVKKWPPLFKNIIFMFQKELGEKIISKFPSKSYGRISILTNYRLNILKKFLVSANCFFPKPKVNSMIIHFQPKKLVSNKIKRIDNLEHITRILFSNKRKMIKKNIQKILINEDLKKIKDLNFNYRPENISPELYYRITELYEEKLYS
tara:strand:+ start:1502 stop:2296 length:795 start_codon:yes stop_codon:yes gene_type:complete